jgi:hypothetical protein
LSVGKIMYVFLILQSWCKWHKWKVQTHTFKSDILTFSCRVPTHLSMVLSWITVILVGKAALWARSQSLLSPGIGKVQSKLVSKRLLHSLNFVAFLSCKLILSVDDRCSQSGVKLTCGIMHTLEVGEPFCKVTSTVLFLWECVYARLSSEEWVAYACEEVTNFFSQCRWGGYTNLGWPEES